MEILVKAYLLSIYIYLLSYKNTRDIEILSFFITMTVCIKVTNFFYFFNVKAIVDLSSF